MSQTTLSEQDAAGTAGAPAFADDHRAVIKEVLETVTDPCSAANGTNFSIVEMGIVKEIGFDGADVTIKLRLTAPGCFMLEYFLQEIPRRVHERLPDVGAVEVEADSGFEWDTGMMDQTRRREYLDALRSSMKAAGREAK